MTGAGRLSSGPQPVMANAAHSASSAPSIADARESPSPAAGSGRDGSPEGENPAKPGCQRQPTAPVPKGDGPTLAECTL